MNDFETMLLVTFIAGSVTGLGAIPILFRTTVSHRIYDAAIGLAAGVMVSASVFGLLIPGTEEGALTSVLFGVFLGAAILLLGNYVIPHLHARYTGWRAEGLRVDTDDEELSRIRRILLIGGAIVLHNAPEGLAIGVAFASGLEEVALLLAIVIGIQNIPDGFAFAVPLGETDLSGLTVLLYTTLSGLLPQLVAALFGFFLVAIATGIFPLAAGFAAGAMLAVVFREMVPLSHGHGYADAATIAFIIGFVILLVLEELLVL